MSIGENGIVDMRKSSSTKKPPPLPVPENNVEPNIVPIDRGPEVVASTLAPQLGSDMTYLSQGKFDMRKLSVIEEKDIPLLMYAYLRSKKTQVWGDIFELFLNLRVSVAGRGRKDIIRMEGVSKGGLPEIQPELERPGWFERNFLNRDWKKKAVEEQL